MIYAACVFGGFWVGYLAACLMVITKGPKPLDYDDREWYDL